MSRNNIHTISWPEDVQQIKFESWTARQFPDFVVDILYSEWSNDAYCAGWMIVTPERIKEFDEWLRMNS